MKPLLVLLHGLGGNADIWEGCRRVYDGPILGPDLAGHGLAEPLSEYRYEHYADDLLARYAKQLKRTPFRLCGHSLGGVVGATLLGQAPGLRCERFVALGVKTEWHDDEIAGAHRVADKGASSFDDAEQAKARFLKVTGLAGIAGHTDRCSERGVRERDGRWYLAIDPNAYRLRPADFGQCLANVRAPTILARGEHDAMAPHEHLARYAASISTIAAASHNAHVEKPDAVIELLTD
ncbi:MAG: alpha/beta hydrolase [Pseudomonadota bacterium]